MNNLIKEKEWEAPREIDCSEYSNSIEKIFWEPCLNYLHQGYGIISVIYKYNTDMKYDCDIKLHFEVFQSINPEKNKHFRSGSGVGTVLNRTKFYKINRNRN